MQIGAADVAAVALGPSVLLPSYGDVLCRRGPLPSVRTRHGGGDRVCSLQDERADGKQREPCLPRLGECRALCSHDDWTLQVELSRPSPLRQQVRGRISFRLSLQVLDHNRNSSNVLGEPNRRTQPVCRNRPRTSTDTESHPFVPPGHACSGPPGAGPLAGQIRRPLRARHGRTWPVASLRRDRPQGGAIDCKAGALAN